MFNNQRGHYPRLPPNRVNNFNSTRPPVTHSGDQWRPRGGPPRFRHANPHNFHNRNASPQGGRPEFNYEHYCETCDRGFKSAQLLEDHLSEHQKCGIDGCKFVAHPNVVTKHIQMQHSTGLYSRLKNLETPDDIAKWIKERKKNYPSKENIEKIKVQKTERIDRGEKLQDPKSRFNNRHKNDSNDCKRRGPKTSFNKNRHEFKRDHNKSKPKREEIKNKAVTEAPSNDIDEDVYCGVLAFKGTSELERNDVLHEENPQPHDDIDIEDTEWQERNANMHVIENAPVCKALTNLMVAYQTSSEEEIVEQKSIEIPNLHFTKELSEINESTCNKKTSILAESKSIEKLPDAGSDSGPEVAAILKADTVPQIVENNKTEEIKCNNQEHSKNTRKRKHPGDEARNGKESNKRNHNRTLTTFQKQLQYYKERPSTLLEKLLVKEIRHERNVILQSINHIVKNNFFDENKPM